MVVWQRKWVNLSYQQLYIYIYIKGDNFKYINFSEMGKSLIKKKETLKVQIIL